MEVCYKGALIMPCKYVVMSGDEMTYLEGGIVWNFYLKKTVNVKWNKGSSTTLVANNIAVAMGLNKVSGSSMVSSCIGSAGMAYLASTTNGGNVTYAMYNSSNSKKYVWSFTAFTGKVFGTYTNIVSGLSIM